MIPSDDTSFLFGGRFMNFVRCLLSLAVFGWGVCVSSVPCVAGEVTDGAGFFSQSVVDAATSRLGTIQKQHGAELRIETISSVPADKVDEVRKMDKEARNRFFSQWTQDRAHSLKAAGVYVLISKDPAHLHMYLNRSFERRGYTNAQELELRELLLKGFKDKKYDSTLQNAVDLFARQVSTMSRSTSGPLGHHGPVRSGPMEPGAGQHPVGGGGGVSWVVLVLIGVVGFFLVTSLVRSMSGGMGGAPGGGYGGGGGSGLFGSLLTGMFGAMAGHWLYDSFFSNSAHAGESHGGFGDSSGGDDANFDNSGSDIGGDYDNSGGGDFGGSDGGGGDFGGGDGGGGDF